MTHLAPSTYPRRVLLAVVGLTPQVLTETLYALVAKGDETFVPTEIHIVTTLEGEERIRLLLLDEQTGALHELTRDYGIPPPAQLLPAGNIHVIRRDDGTALNDIVTQDNNLAAADLMVRLVRRLTGDDMAALHVSIAGGRKTMGFFAGYALSLFGRAQDRMSHVLVPEPFQSHPQFYFPPARGRVLIAQNNRPVSTDDAEVSLADIPFVRLRDRVADVLCPEDLSYADLVAGVQRRFAAPELVLDLEARVARCHGRAVVLPPLPLAWMLWFARRRKRCDSSDGTVSWREMDIDEFVGVYAEVVGNDEDKIDRVRKALLPAVHDDARRAYFEQKTSGLNKLVKRALGGDAWPYCIQRSGRRPHSRFGLPIEPQRIRIVGGADQEE